MIQLTKFLKNDTILSEYNKCCANRDTDWLGDFWCGVFLLNSLIQDKTLYINDTTYCNLQILLGFLSDNCEHYRKFILDVQNFCSMDEVDTVIMNNYDWTLSKNKKLILNLFNLSDLSEKDLGYLRNKFILTKEYKNVGYTNHVISGIFGSVSSDYYTILGLQTEKSCGLLSQAIPIYCDKQKHKGIIQNYKSDGTKYRSFIQNALEFRKHFQAFGISSNGLRHYNQFVINRTRKTGFYGQVLENLKDNYCLKLATVLAFNDLRNFVLFEDVDNSIKILNATMDEAFNRYNIKYNEDPLSGIIEKVLIKIRKTLLLAGLNGIQHRSLYMKVHHDIDNNTFRYIMNILHELGLIEKLKVSHNSYIYRASDTLDAFNIDNILGEIKDF